MNTMNTILLKQIAILSAILGVGLGLLTIIPFICNFSFLALMCLSAAIVIIYMKKKNLVGYLDTKQWAINGAIIGFISFIGFSVAFLPLATIIGLLYKGSYYLGVSLIVRGGIAVVILTVIFLAILSALTNAFSGLTTAYIYSQIEPKPEEEITNIDIEE